MAKIWNIIKTKLSLNPGNNTLYKICHFFLILFFNFESQENLGNLENGTAIRLSK